MDIGAVDSRPWIYGWSVVDRGHMEAGDMGGLW